MYLVRGNHGPGTERPTRCRTQEEEPRRRVLPREPRALSAGRDTGTGEAQRICQRVIVPVHDEVRQVLRRMAGLASDAEDVGHNAISADSPQPPQHLFQLRADLVVPRGVNGPLDFPAPQVHPQPAVLVRRNGERDRPGPVKCQRDIRLWQTDERSRGSPGQPAPTKEEELPPPTPPPPPP